MTFDKAFEMLNLDTKNMGYWTLVQIALIRKVMSGLRETYAKPVEMTREQRDVLISAQKNTKGRIEKMVFLEFMSVYSEVQGDITTEDLMRAWLHPEIIKVVE